jgi:hypothetical protein
MHIMKVVFCINKTTPICHPRHLWLSIHKYGLLLLSDATDYTKILHNWLLRNLLVLYTVPTSAYKL